MKSEIHIKNISELPLLSEGANEMRKKVTSRVIDYNDIIAHFSSAVYLDAMIAILVLSGSGEASINYEAYHLSPDTMLVLSSSHLFHFVHCNRDFKCMCLLVSKAFMEDMDSTDMIYKRTRYGVLLYNCPVIRMEHSQALMLVARMEEVDKSIDNVKHYYYKEVILNRLFAFYLDLSDVIECNADFQNEGSRTRYESIIKSFIELLVRHYHVEHKVEFYASQLNISTHYLTQIVKRVTGQSVCDFIFEMLYSESRNLLMHSELSIQEIASILNFSDQSSFGKFFRRKSGMSPVDFRKKE